LLNLHKSAAKSPYGVRLLSNPIDNGRARRARHTLFLVIPGRRIAASPEPKRTDGAGDARSWFHFAWPVFMGSGLPRFAWAPE